MTVSVLIFSADSDGKIRTCKQMRTKIKYCYFLILLFLTKYSLVFALQAFPFIYNFVQRAFHHHFS